MSLPPWSMAPVALLAAAAVALGLWMILGPRASHERPWQEEHAVLPEFVVEGDRLTVRGVRNFRWSGPAEFEPAWEERVYDLRTLNGVWYALTPFSRNWRGPAHSLLSFQFGEDTFLAVSVEARREEGESYSLLKGLARRFELLYVVGDERDLLGVRAIHRDDQVFLYPMEVDSQGARALLLDMAERANGLRETPEFYNTATNNCTTRIVEHVNRVAPGRVPGSWRILLPGYSDELAWELGLIRTGLSLEETRARWHVNQRARRWSQDPDFSLRIREESAPTEPAGG